MVEMVARKARTQVGDSVTSDSKVFLFKPFFCILLTFFLLPLELPLQFLCMRLQSLASPLGQNK